jgi:hypothetical protein
MLDTVMLCLRTGDGLDLEAFRSRFGPLATARLKKALIPFVERGLVVCGNSASDNSGEAGASFTGDGTSTGDAGSSGGSGVGSDLDTWPVVRLSDPDGFLLSNDIISSLFVGLD